MANLPLPAWGSLRIRLTGWYLLLLGGALLLFSVFLYYQQAQSLWQEQKSILQHASSQLLPSIDSEHHPPLLTKTDSAQQMIHVLIHEGFQVRLMTTDGTLLNTVGEMPGQRFQFPGIAREPAQVSDDQGTHWLVLSQPIKNHQGQIMGWLQSACSLARMEMSLWLFVSQLLLGALLILLLAGWGGVFLANRALRPIEHVTRTARTVSLHDLSQRIAYQGKADEVGRLALTFNQMLDRLEQAFEHERRFTADASHELRTPLTGLKARLEVLLSRPRTGEEYEQALCDLTQDVDRLIALSSSLLLLARLDQDSQPWLAQAFNLSDLLEALVESIRPLAQEIILHTAIAPTLSVNGDFDHLTRVFLNIIDNALKYTPAGGQVRIQAEQAQGGMEISISDSGPGIAPEHLPHLFERFYRVEAHRMSATGGTGLGLAIANEIVRKHGGTLTIQSTPGQGTTAMISLPAHHSEAH